MIVHAERPCSARLEWRHCDRSADSNAGAHFGSRPKRKPAACIEFRPNTDLTHPTIVAPSLTTESTSGWSHHCVNGRGRLAH